MRTLCRLILPFIMPAVVLSATIFLFGKWPAWSSYSDYTRELEAVSVIFPYLPYLLSGFGLLLGWRFHQSGMVLSALLMATAYWCIQQEGSTTDTASLPVLSCLVFTEIAIFTSWRWRQLPIKITVFWAVILLIQSAVLTGTRRLIQSSGMQTDGILSSPLLAHLLSTVRRADWAVISQVHPVLIVFYIVGLYLLILAFQRRDVLATGLLGVLISVFIALMPGQPAGKPAAFFSAAGIILVFSCIEASFIMAYRDDLTGLPSRRALNQALAGLGGHYAIAMIDVDHFKRFNDTYGHKTGDQVLKLLATRLSRMSGSAKAFRYGGEEFTAVFPGKSKEEAIPHLEACRKRLSGTPFIVRGKTRGASSAGRRGKLLAGKARRQVKVTASFGVAEPDFVLKTPAQVLTAADRALYRAKKAGRDCVKF